jgi:hypothetical protein
MANGASYTRMARPIKTLPRIKAVYEEWQDLDCTPGSEIKIRGRNLRLRSSEKLKNKANINYGYGKQ